MEGTIRKHFTDLGILSHSAALLYSSLTGTCPRKVENHSPDTLVYAGCLLLGKEPGSPFGRDAHDPVSLAEQLVLAKLCPRWNGGNS